ncbi:glycosyltransferase family 2 protein [Paenibacillus sp. GCM10012304]
MMREVIPGRVSIIVPCYNSEAYVQSCLNSVFKQTYKEIEIIVVDDGSTDSTWNKIHRWKEIKEQTAKTFSFEDRFYAVKLPRNTGYAGAVNVGMYLAKGEFIAMQDSDDLSHSRRIMRQVESMREHPSLDMIGTSYEYFQDGHFESRKREQWLSYGVSKINAVYKNGGHCVCHGTILFRAGVFDQIGGPIRRGVGVEDYDFIARCIAAGMKVDNLKEPLYFYRRHENQRSREFFRK